MLEYSPRSITRVDNSRLAEVRDGRRFNGSIFHWQGRRLLAYRAAWEPSRIHVAELGDDLQPASSWPVTLTHPKCAGGQEDPRLCSLGGRLHLQFAGIEWGPRGELHVSVMMARLTDDLRVEKIWEPQYPRRTWMEKNWGPFECDGPAYTVYEIGPVHRVLKLDLLAGTAADAYDTPGPRPWAGGLLRGGAPPVRVGEVFYSWFHGWLRIGDFYRYAVGVYTFSAAPPFRPLRITPGPVWRPDASLDHLNRPNDRTVIFPCGALLDGGRWLVSAGHQDSFVEIGEFGQSDVDSWLVPVEAS